MLEPSDRQCRTILLFSTPWTLTCLATVLAKTNRLQRLFNSSAFTRLKLLSTPYQLLFILVVTMVGEAIAIVAVTVAKPEAERIMASRTEVNLVCQGSKFTKWYGTIVAYHIVLIAMCLCVATRVRKLPERYNEARHIFMASFCTFVVWLALGPAFFITEGLLQSFIIALSSSAQMWSLWACLFAPRLYQLLSSRARAKQTKYGMSSSVTFQHSQRRAGKEKGRMEPELRRRAPGLASMGRSTTITSEVSYEMDDMKLPASSKILVMSNSSSFPNGSQFLRELHLDDSVVESSCSTPCAVTPTSDSAGHP